MEVLHNEKGDLQAKLEKMFAFAKANEKAKIYVEDIKSKGEFIVSFRWEGSSEEFKEAMENHFNKLETELEIKKMFSQKKG